MSTLHFIYSDLDRLSLETFCKSSTKEKFSTLNSAKTYIGYINKHDDIKNLVQNHIFKRYDDIDDQTSLCEILYRIKNNINIIPTCPSCGNKLKYKNFKNGYGIICSSSCNMGTDTIINKFKQSIEKRNSKNKKIYDLTKISEENDNYILSIFLIKRKSGTITADGNKCNLNCKWPQSHQNEMMYLLNRFPDTNNIYEILYRIYYHINCNPGCKVCGKQVKFISFAKGYNKTCSHSCKTLLPETREKMLNTINRLNNENPNRKQEIVQKINKTFREHLLNGTIQTSYTTNCTIYLSKNEERLKNTLIKLYGEDDILMHYRDKRYMRQYDKYLYECDFYIKSLDLFIECQAFITHGEHPYDKNDKNDKEKLKEIKIRAEQYKQLHPEKEKSIYNDIILTWTKYDIIKRNIAKKNNLNYIEIFGNDYNKEKIKNLINSYFSSSSNK